MLTQIPKLKAKKPGIGVRSLALVSGGVRAVLKQIEPYTNWWTDQNQQALSDSGPLLVVIGDSTAIGIGASSAEQGYVGHVVRGLSQRDDEQWRVINLAQSGARVNDGLTRQLPTVESLVEHGPKPNLVISCIGANDIVWGREIVQLRADIQRLIGGLQAPAIVCELGGESPRTRMANRAIRNAASEQKLDFISPWSEPGPDYKQRLSSDRFHPNDLGYALMSQAFLRRLDCQELDPADFVR